MKEIYLTALLFFLLLGCANKIEQSYTVTVVQAEQVVVDGSNTEDLWSSVAPITSFINPWSAGNTPHTSLKFIADTNFLYFFFEVYDSEIVVSENFRQERDIESGDRVELFFSKDKKMQNYYCFEIDPQARVLSYEAKYYREFDFTWEPPVGFRVGSQLTKYGYMVEGAIPMEFIKALSSNDEVYFGAYRAEFSLNTKGELVENWLTLIDPKVDTPDFHIPESLVKLAFKGF